MSFRSEMHELGETLRPAARAMFGGAALTFSGEWLEFLSEDHLKRGAFPEPFDIASHIGNFREGAMFTAAAFAMIGVGRFATPLIEKSRDLFKKRAQQTAVAAFAVSSAIQVVGEKYALNNYSAASAVNTGDPLDAAYGILWSGVTAYGAYRLAKSEEQRHYDRQVVREAELHQLIEAN